MARAALATVRLRSGVLDAAIATLKLALSLPPAKRITSVLPRMLLVCLELGASVFHDPTPTPELEERTRGVRARQRDDRAALPAKCFRDCGGRRAHGSLGDNLDASAAMTATEPTPLATGRLAP